MKKFSLLVSISLLSLLCLGPVSLRVSSQSNVLSSPVTLYSDIKHRGEGRRSCLSLQPRPRLTPSSAPCDLRYGGLYAGDDLDWFSSLLGADSRSVVRDLGLLSWTDQFTVPAVAPLPKLKPGELRHVTVDTSGADGEDGAPGARGRDGAPGQDGADAGGIVLPRERSERPEPPNVAPLASPPRPRHDGRPKIDPVFTKAIPGHLYVIHVVDEVADFYALFHVDALERGDNCTISWRLIPNPETQTTVRK